jgi:hypothetical protein
MITSIIGALIGDDFINLTHNQREALDYATTGRSFRDLTPRVQGATSIDELVEALQHRAGGWGVGGDHTVTANGMDITDRDALRTALAGALDDPGNVSFQWNQGLEETKRGNLETIINNLVRNQLAIIRGNELGDPRAKEMLTFGGGRKGQYLLNKLMTEGSAYQSSPEGTPGGLDPNFDWAAVQKCTVEHTYVV